VSTEKVTEVCLVDTSILSGLEMSSQQCAI